MTTKPSLILIIIPLIIVLAAAIIIGFLYFKKDKQPPGNNINLTGLSNTEPVEYNESYGTICPLGVKFLGEKGANPIGCQCPQGYELNSEIIGYSSGESCYGPGTECPIMSSECAPVKNQ